MRCDVDDVTHITALEVDHLQAGTVSGQLQHRRVIYLVTALGDEVRQLRTAPRQGLHTWRVNRSGQRAQQGRGQDACRRVNVTGSDAIPACIVTRVLESVDLS